VKVQVPYFVFDDRLKAYFKKTQEFVAQDPSRVCKTGDVVIIQKLEHQVSSLHFSGHRYEQMFLIF
jgi:ribosomal protein S17